MTEPVAWRAKNIGYDAYIIYDHKPLYFDTVELLYTAEQLHPRVKMTQSEFDDFKQLYSENYFKRAFFVLEKIEKGEFGGLYGKFGAFIKDLPIFANLWVNYDPEHPEKTIEIIPEMKWFVRSKEPDGEDEDEYYLFLSGSDLDDLEYFGFDYARAFDTKEEAELWTTPLTEAVQLPVEDE